MAVAIIEGVAVAGHEFVDANARIWNGVSDKGVEIHYCNGIDSIIAGDAKLGGEGAFATSRAELKGDSIAAKGGDRGRCGDDFEVVGVTPGKFGPGDAEALSSTKIVDRN